MPKALLTTANAANAADFVGFSEEPAGSDSRIIDLGKLTQDICEEEMRAAAAAAARLGFTHAKLTTVHGGLLFIPAKFPGHRPVCPRCHNPAPFTIVDAMAKFPNGKN